MTRDEITRIAREAGFCGFDGENAALRRFATLVSAAEREECAQIIESIAAQYTEPTWAYQILRAIRGD